MSARSQTVQREDSRRPLGKRPSFTQRQNVETATPRNFAASWARIVGGNESVRHKKTSCVFIKLRKRLQEQ